MDYETELWLQWIPGVRGMEIRSQGPPNVESIIGEPHIKVEHRSQLIPSHPPQRAMERVALIQHRAEQEEKKRKPRPQEAVTIGIFEA